MFRPMYSKQVFVIWTLFGFISVFLSAVLLKFEITVSFLWLSLPVHSGSLKRIKYSKLYSLAHTLLLNIFSALKGTCFYILLDVHWMSFFFFLLFVTLSTPHTMTHVLGVQLICIRCSFLTCKQNCYFQ